MPVRELAAFGVLDHLGEGAASSVYAVEGEPGVVLKQYHRPHEVRFVELDRLGGRIAALPPPLRAFVTGSAAWPGDVVADAGEPFGVLMPRTGERFPTALLTDAGALPWSRRLGLALTLTGFCELLHRHDIVAGPGLARVRRAAEGTGVFVPSGDRFRIVGRPHPREPHAEAAGGPTAVRADCRVLVALSVGLLLGRDVAPGEVATEPCGELGPAVARRLELAASGVWPTAAQWRRTLAAVGARPKAVAA